MRRLLLSLAVTALLDAIGFGIIIPILPYYVLKLGATPTEFSLLTVAYSVGQLLFSPYVSRLSDVRGRKNILALGITSEVIGYLVIGLSPFFYLLLFARFLTGALTSNLPVLLSYVSDVGKREERSRNIGIISGSYGVGFVAGPVLGGVLSPLGYKTTFLIVALLALVNLVLVMVNLSRDDGGAKVARTPLKEIFSSSASFFVLILAVGTSFAVLQGTLAFYGNHFYSWGPPQVGLVLGLVGVVQAITQFGLVYKVVDRIGEEKTVVLGLTLSLLAYVLLSFPGGDVLAYVSLVVLALGNGVTQNSLLTLLSRVVPPQIRGGAFGFAQSSTALGSLIGFPAGDILFQYVSANSEYVLCSVLILADLVYLLKVYGGKAKFTS